MEGRGRDKLLNAKQMQDSYEISNALLPTVIMAKHPSDFQTFFLGNMKTLEKKKRYDNFLKMKILKKEKF